MRSVFLLLSLVILSWGNTPSKVSDVPSGFSVVAEAVGDVTGDGVADVVRIIDKPIPSENSEIRRLQVYKGSGNGGYSLIIDNDKAMWGSQDGGQMGDPFTDLSIKRGSIFISYYGGSGWRWGVTFQFLKRNGQLSLVGKESESFHVSTDEKKTTSINFLSGKTLVRERKYNEEARKLEPWVETWKTQGKKPLIPLNTFDINRDAQE